MKTGMKIFFALVFLIIAAGCSKGSESDSPKNENEIRKGREYRIVIVMDTIDDWSSGIRDGFKETMDSILLKYDAKAVYEIYDTELDEKKAAGILETVKVAKPDLICAINYPTVFADLMISSKLTGPEYKIVSENCIPVQSKIINSWEKPGGNITGVGVFVQMNSPIRLMKKLDPKRNKLVFYSWDAVSILNEWFREEITRAAKEENIQLLEFKEVKSQEDTFRFFKKYANKKDTFIIGGISAFVHEDGTDANDKDEVRWFRENMKIPYISYDETAISDGLMAGTSVIWYDIGAQLAEKSELILKGVNPGDIAWDYPRKYNIILNKKRASELKIEIPQEIISAAYRIYTDYNGKFVGQDK